MSNTFCCASQEQRQTILLLEAFGLIHDLGKLSEHFLRSQAPQGKKECDYEYSLFVDPRQIDLYNRKSKVLKGEVKKWLNNSDKKPCAFSLRPDLTASLNEIEITGWDDARYTLAELAPFVSQPGLSQKDEWQEILGKSMQPGLLIGYMHGIAHIDKENNTSEKQSYEDAWRATPFGFEEKIQKESEEELTNALKALPLEADNIRKIATQDRQQWLKDMRHGMRKGIADNRRPINEVSLWDWGYIVASLTKAAVNYIIKKSWPESLMDIGFVTLRVNLDKVEHYASSDKISDLLGLKMEMDKSYEKVRKQLEVKYALGNRIYHDETGDYYLLADIFDSEAIDALRKDIQEQFPKDLQPRVHFGQPVTAKEIDGKINTDRSSWRDAIHQLISDPLQHAMKEPTIQADNNLYLFTKEWGKERPDNSEICSVCGVRPVAYPEENSKPEEEEKLAKWATQEKAEERHVCRYCLQRRGRRAAEWGEEIEKGQQSTTIWTDEVADNNGRLALLVGTMGLKKWLSGDALESTRFSKNTSKNSSPARLYRIAETARDFWQEISKQMLTENSGKRFERLKLLPSKNQDLNHYYTYELDISGTILGVVWDAQKKCFITTENLTTIAAQQDFGEGDVTGWFNWLGNSKTYIRIPSSFGKKGKKIHEVSFSAVVPLESYFPVIQLLQEPAVCMAFLPAEQALKAASFIKRAYEKQMNKVQDRLPLGVGLVFFPKRTPIRAVMEAGKSMMKMLDANPYEVWQVKKVGDSTDILELSFSNDTTIKYKVKNGNSGEIVDKWYLWYFNECRAVRPINEIKNSDRITVWPGRFDFEFLDTTGRRFDIYYDKNGRRIPRTRPFYLFDFERLEILWSYLQCLSKSQRYQVIGLIEAKREEWGLKDMAPGEIKDPVLKVFRKFVENTLAGAQWPENVQWRDYKNKLVEAGFRGELKDLMELHMEILKSQNGGYKG